MYFTTFFGVLQFFRLGILGILGNKRPWHHILGTVYGSGYNCKTGIVQKYEDKFKEGAWNKVGGVTPILMLKVIIFGSNDLNTWQPSLPFPVFSYMGHILQDGENACFMSLFSKKVKGLCRHKLILTTLKIGQYLLEFQPHSLGAGSQTQPVWLKFQQILTDLQSAVTRVPDEQ